MDILSLNNVFKTSLSISNSIQILNLSVLTEGTLIPKLCKQKGSGDEGQNQVKRRADKRFLVALTRGTRQSGNPVDTDNNETGAVCSRGAEGGAG